jgi:hypothetical protein
VLWGLGSRGIFVVEFADHSVLQEHNGNQGMGIHDFVGKAIFNRNRTNDSALFSLLFLPATPLGKKI